MMKKYGFGIIVVALIFSSYFLAQGIARTQEQQSDVLQTGRVALNGVIITVDRATTDAERAQGLSNQESLAPDHGLLFVFASDDYHGIWMKDMNFPIDIIWLDAQHRIVDVAAYVTPDTYPQIFLPQKKARFVLETHAGFAARTDARIGDEVLLLP